MAEKSEGFGTADVPWCQPESGSTEVANSGNLGLGRYARALASFIARCETPMTIAIQGEWGSGKTSLMNMVEAQLRQEDDRLLVEEGRPPWLIHRFETWQYGVVGGDPFLGFRLLESIIAAIRSSVDATTRPALFNKVAGLAGAMGRTIVRVATGPAARAVGAGILADHLQGVADGQWTIDSLTNAVSSASSGAPADLGRLRGLFTELVERLVAAEKCRAGDSRVIIFVDDLDRVLPWNAVALLEVLKNFMDVKHCVFVVACDYEVVRLGVKEKLGITELGKVDQFFHKIFQVPFRMPVENYQIQGLLRDYLKKKRVGKAGVEPSPHLQAVVTRAVGTNPRAFKRFVNTVDLLSCLSSDARPVAGDSCSRGGPETAPRKDAPAGLVTPSVWGNDRSYTILLALVALQTRWPGVAAKLSQACSDPDALLAFLVGMQRAPTEGDLEREDPDGRLGEFFDDDRQFTFHDGKPVEWHTHPEYKELGMYVGDFVKILDADDSRSLGPEELAPLQCWLENLALTALGRQGAKESGWEQLARSLAQAEGGASLLRLARKLRDAKIGWKAIRPLSSAGSLSFNIVFSDGAGKPRWFSALSITRAGSIFVARTGREASSQLISGELAAAADALRSATEWLQWRELQDSGRISPTVLLGRCPESTISAFCVYLGAVNQAWEKVVAVQAGQTIGGAEPTVVTDVPTNASVEGASSA